VRRLSRDDTRALLQGVPTAFQTQINDALLTALALALHAWTGSRTLRVDLEGHGREHVADELDVSRTVGWFTTLFPIALDVGSDPDTVGTLLSIKDQLAEVPDRGFSYGLLRYLSPDAAVRDALASVPASPVLFNYLGQFDAVVANSSLFSFAAESTGPWRSPRARRTHALEIVAMVRDDQMEIAWHHDADDRHETSIAHAAEAMLNALKDLIARAGSHRSRAPAPADLQPVHLDDAALARLSQRIPQIEDIYPLTAMQRLFFAMETSQSNLGFEQWHFRLDGTVDTERLRRAFEHVVERHGMLRTAFVVEGAAEPVQIVCAGVTLPWSEEDWRGIGPADQARRLADLLAADARASFDLARPPLLRVALRRVSDDAYHFVWSTHHLCIDGWSWPIVLADVSRAYEALEAGTQASLTKAASFRTYVEWLARSAPNSEEFWKAQLAGVSAPTPLRLGAGQKTSVEQASDPFAEVVTSLAAPTTDALRDVARRTHVTLSAIFNAAWSLLLAHHSGAHTVVFGAAFSGRPAEIEGIESLVGPCVNNVPVRVTVDPTSALGPWLTQIQQLQFEVAQHQYAPLEEIQRWAGIPWRYRLFDSLVVFQNYRVEAEARQIGTRIRSTLISAPEATNYPLTVAVAVESQLRIRLIFRPEALAHAEVMRVADDLSTVLSALASARDATVGDILALLPDDSRGHAADSAPALLPVRANVFSAPASGAEREIASVWQELFGVDRVSLDDNFFDLGGHSLLLLQAHERFKARLRPDLPIVALLQYPTVRSLARHISGNSGDPQETSGGVANRAQKQREAQMRRRSLTERR